ncbi:Protein kinase [Gracilaria domingensis]|nr:Protein kinase [Gracilaria domingensis]
MNEAVTLLCIPDQPNIVPIVDVYENARTLYVVNDYAGVKTLTGVVQYRDILCEADVATMISGLLRALVHMKHSLLVHRFITPDNILLLAHHGDIAVPGLHNFEYVVSNAYLKDSTSMSKWYSANGPLSLSQLAYMAPEVARDDVGDSQQDVWGKRTFSGALWGGGTCGAKNLCDSLLQSNTKFRVGASDALLHT